MAKTLNTITLSYSWLNRLYNSYHDSETQRILEAFVAADLEGERLEALVTALRTARQAEDTAYKRLSDKDFKVEDLKGADALQDRYMATVRLLLQALTHLPETVSDDAATRRTARELEQTFRDFGFKADDGYESEASKVLNMMQVWTARQQDCQSLGVWGYMQKAAQAARQVLTITGQRIDTDAERIKGEMQAARAATDQAVADLYQLLNALAIVSPSADLEALMRKLQQIQQRAEQYYIGRAGQGSSPEPEPEPDPEPEPEPDGGSDVTPVTPA